MTVSRFSEIALAISIGLAGALLYDFGSNLFSVRELARGAISESLYAESFLCKVLLAASIAAGGILVSATLKPSPIAIGGLALFLTQVSLQGAAVPFRARDMAAVPAWFGAASRTLGLAGLLLLDGLLGSSAMVIAVICLQDLCGLVIVCAAAWRIGFFRVFGVRRRNPWKGAWRYGVASLGVAMAQLDIVVLGATAGPSAAGIYGAVNRWIQPFNMLAASVAITVTPCVARNPTWIQLRQVVRSHRILLSAASLGGVGVALSSQVLVGLLLGDGYESAALPLFFLGWGAALAVWSQPLAATMQALGREALVARLLPAVSLTRLVVIAAMAPHLSTSAAAFSYLASQAAILIVLSIALFRGVSTGAG
jgi:O-antigen/teichoic acid export membrane protein